MKHLPQLPVLDQEQQERAMAVVAKLYLQRAKDENLNPAEREVGLAGVVRIMRHHPRLTNNDLGLPLEIFQRLRGLAR